MSLASQGLEPLMLIMLCAPIQLVDGKIYQKQAYTETYQLVFCMRYDTPIVRHQTFETNHSY